MEPLFDPQLAARLAVAVGLGFLLGLEREWASREEERRFGGVRTFPLIALTGAASVHAGQALELPGLTLAVFAAIATLVAVSYLASSRAGELGITTELRLGNLQSKRDWGYAGDFVRAMWLILQQDQPDDYVIGTGETHTVQEFVEIAADQAGIDWKKHVVVDPQFYRPAEVDLLLSDPTKARTKLGWKPQVSFEELVRMMVDEDLRTLRIKVPFGCYIHIRSVTWQQP